MGNEGGNSRFREEIFSHKVRAGKRTYFFDVKVTRSNEHYLTLTESKKVGDSDSPSYEKHKIFLYQEDFDGFVEGLESVVEFIKSKAASEDKFVDEVVEFDDL